jgi:L-seryl-tRNA(Ser) seleniumtransferase
LHLPDEPRLDVTAVRPPSVSRLLDIEAGRTLVTRFGHKPTVAALRTAITQARGCGNLADEAIIASAGSALSAECRPRLRPVWNLTGTVLHTNLGRAVLSQRAIDAAVAAMARPIALEYDLVSGQRGSRDDALKDALRALTGAEDAVLVNNNAAAVLLVLDTFARGGEVIVSRGELIEIGGAFRMPEIMEATGAILREVGTTNRTHLGDYERAIGENTRLILKVHPSNFRIEGFTSDVPASALAPLAKRCDIPLVNDLGSGTLVDISRFGLPQEPTVSEAVAEGADIVTFSGDKLLGGPQAGFAIGRTDLIERLARNPLKRALRLDKVRLAAVEAVLEDYLIAANPQQAAPTLALLARSVEEISARAAKLRPLVAEVLGERFSVEAIECQSQVGSGAAPTATLPSAGLAIRAFCQEILGEFAAALRGLPEPVIGRLAGGALLLDLRGLLREHEQAFLANLRRLR